MSHDWSAFPQLMEISVKMAITLRGGVSINCIYYTIFSKALCLSFCQIPPYGCPYQDSHMQIICGNPVTGPLYRTVPQTIQACFAVSIRKWLITVGV